MKRMIFLGMFMLSPYVPAQTQQHINLQDVLAHALTHNQALQAADARLRSATIDVERSRALEDPQIEFMTEDHEFNRKNNSAADAGDGMTGTETAPMSEMAYMREYRLTQMLPYPGKRDLQQNIAKKMLLQSQSRAQGTRNDLLFNVKSTYFQLLLNEQWRRYNEEAAYLMKQMAADALIRYRAGMADYAEVLKMQVEIQMVEADRIMLEGDRQAMSSMLAALSYWPELKQGELTLSENYSTDITVDKTAILSAAIKNRPDLEVMRAMAAERQLMADMAKREAYPDFMLSASLKEIPDEDRTAWGLGVGVKVPVFYGAKQQKAYASLSAQSHALTLDTKAMEVMLQAEIDEHLGKLTAINKKISFFDSDLIPAAEQAWKISLARYRVGKIELVMMLDAWREWLDAKKQRASARVDREILLASLEKITGVSIQENAHAN